jgi:flavin reductase (DIM6/NTAB) family NADH-FMN oxidoreductase RutF
MTTTRPKANGLLDSLQPYRYQWPAAPFIDDAAWRADDQHEYLLRDLPENEEDMRRDSRWPALFPAPMCIVTTGDGQVGAMEREVGASIVNRFPYVVAISLCRQSLSSRHHERANFMRLLERTGAACLQFLAPGPELNAALDAIGAVPDERVTERIARSGLRTRRCETNGAPVLEAAYLAYEAKLVKPQKDFDGRPIYSSPWIDVGSHRVYFLEINTIQLREDIATGRSQIHWRALPVWSPEEQPQAANAGNVAAAAAKARYSKPYNPNYAFPAASTIAFEFDASRHGMAIKHLPPLPEDQVEVDNDRARWPCFFPSSCGLITTWGDDGQPNLMPCGSTTVVSRHPFVIAPCVSYARINERYAARHSLGILRATKRFGCSVPYIDDVVINGMKYAGNNSMADDPRKVANSGLSVGPSEYGPVIKQAPIHFDCEVVGEVLLGTHVMFLGEVKRIHVRADVSPARPLEWCPWPGLASAA